MRTLTLDIPVDIMNSAKIPRPRWKSELKKELALQLYREGIVSFADARNLAGLSKLEFHYLLGERKIPRQYDIEDFEQDIENLEKWSKDK